MPRTTVEYRQSAPTARVQKVVQLRVAFAFLDADKPRRVVDGERLLQRLAHRVAGLLTGERGFDGPAGQAVVAVPGALGEHLDDRDDLALLL